MRELLRRPETQGMVDTTLLLGEVIGRLFPGANYIFIVFTENQEKGTYSSNAPRPEVISVLKNFIMQAEDLQAREEQKRQQQEAPDLSDDVPAEGTDIRKFRVH